MSQLLKNHNNLKKRTKQAKTKKLTAGIAKVADEKTELK
jgi:hypothetical protein